MALESHTSEDLFEKSFKKFFESKQNPENFKLLQLLH